MVAHHNPKDHAFNIHHENLICDNSKDLAPWSLVMPLNYNTTAIIKP
jgi:hypothetical protein